MGLVYPAFNVEEGDERSMMEDVVVDAEEEHEQDSCPREVLLPLVLASPFLRWTSQSDIR